MDFDITFRRMGDRRHRHIVQTCESMEKAIQLTKDQYPGCLVINAILLP